MNKDKLEIERLLLKKIINEVHNDSIRISDSCQREIILLVRSRIPEGKSMDELDLKEIKTLIEMFSEKINSAAPKSKDPKKRAVIRRSLFENVKNFLSHIWPFGE